MASYLGNVQDKVTSVRPPETNWQFEAQLLSTRQGKYDAGHKKLSEMYGKLLNSGLTREGNIKSREEFFKLIDSDLRKVAGIDLSLDSNVSQAQNVFSQIYDNDYLVKDMVWTKNFQNEMQRADGFKSCLDITKCGGQYWDDGVKYMNYKREEFKNASNDESMSARDVEFIPYNNIVAQAMEDMKTANLNVTTMPDPEGGKWKVKVKNGENLISPLFDLFSGLYAKDPKFQDVYKVMSYNARKDWTYEAVQSGKFATLEEAAVGFVEERAELIQKNFNRISHGVKYDTDALQAKYDAYIEDSEKGLLTQKDIPEFEKTSSLLDKSKELDVYLEQVKSAQKNMNAQSSMNNIGSFLDEIQSFNLFNDDITKAAITFSNVDSEITREENKYALAEQQHGFDVAMSHLEFAQKMEFEEFQATLGKYTDKTGAALDKQAIKELVAQKALANANALEIVPAFVNSIKSNPFYEDISLPEGLQDNMTESQVKSWIDSLDSKDLRQSVTDTYNDLVAEKENLNKTVNIRNLEAVNVGVSAATLQWKWEAIDAPVMTSMMNNENIVANTPMKAQLEYNFTEQDPNAANYNKRARFYTGKKTGDRFVIDSDGIWHTAKAGADWKNKASWEKVGINPKTKRQYTWGYWDAGQLKSTKY